MKNKVAKDDILLRLNLSRASVYKGEPLRASLTLYTRVGIAGFENVKLPSFNGFWSQELPTDNYTTNRQTLDGKVYDTRIIKEYLLYPQQAGTLTIDPAALSACQTLSGKRAGAEETKTLGTPPRKKAPSSSLGKG